MTDSNGVAVVPEVGEVLPGMTVEDQFRRKVKVTKFIAILEAVTYSLLAFFMFRKYALDMRGGSNQFWLRIVAYFHGFISIAFAVMVFDIFRVMKWSVQFVIVTLLGPPGALIAHHRLRKQPFPAVVRKKDMLF
jgi:integral membrane protein